MSDGEFNPKSTDAMFATILSEMREVRRTVTEMHESHKSVDARVGVLEREKWYQRGVTGTIAVLAGGAWEYWKSK